MASLLDRNPFFKEKKCHVDIQVQKVAANPPDFVGPFLKVDKTQHNTWFGNVLLVHKDKLHPTLCLDGTSERVTIVQRVQLAHLYGFTFTRWDIAIKQNHVSTRQEYTIVLKNTNSPPEQPDRCTKQYCFFIPGTQSPWRWAFFSCNDLSHTSGFAGYSEKYGGIIPLWTDLVHKHHKYNYNMLVGLGDQVYLDEVFEHVPELDFWTRLSDRKDRENMACPKGLKENVRKWTFFYYLHHFSQPYFDQAMATIPTLYVMSDHDTYDGQGSYPIELENCPVMTSVRRILQSFYLLFQQHQDPTIYFNRKDGIDPTPLYGDTITPCLKQMGADLAILALDTRFERSKQQIIAKSTYDYIFAQLHSLPSSVIHLVVATEIPLIFPDLRRGENFLQKVANVKRTNAFNKIFRNISVFKRLGFPFGEPTLLTDMVDHWNSSCHIDERDEFLFKLQTFAKEKSIRVTFIGGDVHCCGVG